ncbi:MAG: hypothetical protein CMC96_10260 [Flavobacteriales bacterium]|nr:hypothetical protein [Flavobacteriales bacterium]|tara:strand:- start:81604 stop:81945 length:342 start_codon:yes stop_codon:yes gene_type:complete
MSKNEFRWYVVFNSEREQNEYIKEGRLSKVLVEEKWVCIAKSSGEIYAFDELCPHQNYPLVHGHCENGKVECPLHKYKFDLKSGRGHGLSLQTYPLKKENGRLYIGFKKGFWD